MQFLKDFFQVGGSLNCMTNCGDYGDNNNYEDCNVYVLKTGEGLVMFDCGNGETLEQIFENMKYWSLDPADIRACMITHPHLDHAGACYRLKQMGFKLYAHENTAQAIAAGDERCCGYLYHKKFVPCAVDAYVSDGDVLNFGGVEMKVMYLPGHTMGCTAFCFQWENKETVVSGDVIGTLSGGDFGWSGSIDFDKAIYLKSLIRFARYQPDLMLPGHGLIHYGNPQSRVETSLNHALKEWR